MLNLSEKYPDLYMDFKPMMDKLLISLVNKYTGDRIVVVTVEGKEALGDLREAIDLALGSGG